MSMFQAGPACVLLLSLVACDVGEPTALTDPGTVSANASSERGPVIASVTGSGHFTTRPPALSPGLWRTFTLTARKYADGSVDGTFTRVEHLADGGVRTLHGAVSCFTIVGNTAWIGWSNPGGTPSDVAWQVVDNGEGAGDPPDQVGLQLDAATFGFPAGFAHDFCADTPNALDFGPRFGVVPLSALLTDIEAGNVQIRVEG